MSTQSEGSPLEQSFSKNQQNEGDMTKTQERIEENLLFDQSEIERQKAWQQFNMTLQETEKE